MPSSEEPGCFPALPQGKNLSLREAEALAAQERSDEAIPNDGHAGKLAMSYDRDCHVAQLLLAEEP